MARSSISEEPYIIISVERPSRRSCAVDCSTRAPGAEVPLRAASTPGGSGRLFEMRRLIVVAEGERQISAFDVDIQIAAVRDRPRSTRRRRVVSHPRWDQTDIPRPVEERSEGFRTGSIASGLVGFRPSGPAARRLSLHATGHGRGTRAPGDTRDTRCHLHRRTRQWAVCSTSPHDRWRGGGDMRADRLALPATLPWRRKRVSVTPCDAARGYFHLGHRRGAMFTAQPRCAAGHQLLGAKRRHDRKLVGVQMRWT